MRDRDADEQFSKQPESFRHPLVVSAALRWAEAVAPGVQEPSDMPLAAEYADVLNVSLPRAVEAIPDEPVAQRMSRRLLEKRGAAQ